MNKVLFISTYGDFLTSFELSNIAIYLSYGYEVHCACNFSVAKYNKHTDILKEKKLVLHDVSFARKPTNLLLVKKNINSIRKIIRDNNIGVIDSHNAVCGVIARIAGEKEKISKVIYTPHSFFFYKGCSLKNKLIFKKIEYLMAKKTDLLITINKEDYDAALKMKVRGKAIYVPGVGVDTKKINQIDSYDRFSFYPSEYVIDKNTTIFVSVGEMILRKNYDTVLEALAKIKDMDYIYTIVGLGDLEETLKAKCKELGIEKKVYFAGYRNDVIRIVKMADAFILSSFQEGLCVALMEAMACGKYCITSKIRGNVDLIKNKINGELFDPKDVSKLSLIAKEFILNKNELLIKGESNRDVIKEFDIDNVRRIMQNEYKTLLE